MKLSKFWRANLIFLSSIYLCISYNEFTAAIHVEWASNETKYTINKWFSSAGSTSPHPKTKHFKYMSLLEYIQKHTPMCLNVYVSIRILQKHTPDNECQCVCLYYSFYRSTHPHNACQCVCLCYSTSIPSPPCFHPCCISSSQIPTKQILLAHPSPKQLRGWMVGFKCFLGNDGL